MQHLKLLSSLAISVQVRYADSDDDDNDDDHQVDDEVFAQKMQQQLNSSRPRRAAAMQATAQMMVSAASAQPCLCSSGDVFCIWKTLVASNMLHHALLGSTLSLSVLNNVLCADAS